MQLHNLFSVQNDTFRHVHESFEIPLSSKQPDNPASYDLCLVFPLRRKELGMEMVHILERIISTCGRKYVYMYNSPDDSKRFVLIRGGSTRLRSKAEQTAAKLPLDDRQCLLLAQQGNPEANIAPIYIAHSPHISAFKPFEYLFGRYVTRDDKVEVLYRTVDAETNAGGLFQKADRIRLLDLMLNDSQADDGAEANIPRLLADESLLAYFPVHSNEPVGEGTFAHDLVSCCVAPWHKPLDEVNDYFGSRIAFYLAFQCHVSSWIVLPAAVGVAFQAAAVSLHNYSRPEIPVFAFMVAVWAMLLHEHWKRQEKRWALRWNSIDVDEVGAAHSAGAPVRPKFDGVKLDHSHIDGRPTVFYRHPRNWLRAVIHSVIGLAVISMSAIGVVAAIYVVRWLLYNTPVGRFNQFVSSGINALTILVLQAAFRMIAIFLADLENHRTDQEYYDALTVKVVLFSFVNNFTAFYYLAFGARYLPQGGNKVSVGMCGYDDCMVALGINLATLFGLRLTLGLFVRRVLPFLHNAYRHGHCTCFHLYYFCRKVICKCGFRLFLCRRYYSEDDEVAAQYELQVQQEADAEAEEKGGDGELSLRDKQLEDWGYSRAEWEYLLPEYATDRLTFHMADQMITFGQMTLFVAALPGGLVLGLIFYVLTFNADCWMLLRRYRRPWPSKASGLGHYWNSCLGLLVTLSISTNAALVAFTMQTLDGQTMAAKLGVFVAFQYAIFVIQYLVQALSPVMPADVVIQLARQEVVVRKLIDRVPDKHRLDPRDGQLITPVAVL